jgi:A/G-specific adenine glycosylase
VMAVLRVADAPVAPEMFHQAAADLGFEADGIGIPLAALHRLSSGPEQLERALAGLVSDGLAELHLGGLRLPA